MDSWIDWAMSLDDITRDWIYCLLGYAEYDKPSHEACPARLSQAVTGEHLSAYMTDAATSCCGAIKRVCCMGCDAHSVALLSIEIGYVTLLNGGGCDLGNGLRSVYCWGCSPRSLVLSIL